MTSSNNKTPFNNISNQQDAAKFALLIVLNLLYMFWVTVSPIFRRTLTVYTAFWNNVLTLLSLPAGDTDWIYTVKVLLKMGETVTQNMYSKLKRINRTNFAASSWLLISLY